MNKGGHLNILYVGTLPPHPGGSAISSSILLVGLARSGHRIRAIAPMTAEASQGGDGFAASHPEIAVTRVLMPFFESAPNLPASEEYRALERQQITEAFSALVTRERPDVAFIGRETFGWYLPELARVHGVPSVLRAAGGVTNGILTGTIPPHLAEDLLRQLRLVQAIISPAHHLADTLRQMGCRNVTTIPNAVDLDWFFPAPRDASVARSLAIRPDELVVVHASNLKPLKRPLDILDSAARALQRNPRLVYVIVGDGLLRNALEDACRAKRLTERFRFAGWVDYARMPAYINLADIVLMPSEAEGLARVYLETQACGRVLVASDIPAAHEVVTDGETGLLFRVGDADDLAEKTLRAAGDPELRARIGRNGVERVKVHALSVAVASYVEVLTRAARGDDAR